MLFETASATEIQHRLQEEVYVTWVEVAAGSPEPDGEEDSGGHRVDGERGKLDIYKALYEIQSRRGDKG